MKILMIGTFSGLKPAKGFFASSPSTEFKMAMGFKELGHEAIQINCLNKPKDQLLAAIKDAIGYIKFDLALIGNVFKMIPGQEVMRVLKSESIPIAVWHGDVRHEMEPHVLKNARYADAFFLTSGGKRLKEYKDALGVPVAAYMFNPAVDFDEVKGSNPNKISVLFTGAYGKDGLSSEVDLLRNEIINKLLKRVGIVAYTPGYDSTRIQGEEYIKAIKDCFIGLGVNRYVNIEKYTSERMADFMGNGALYVCNRNPGLDEMFIDGTDCFFFDNNLKSFENVFDMIMDRSLRDLNKIRISGQEHMLEHFGASQICQYILDVALGGDSKVWWKEILK